MNDLNSTAIAPIVEDLIDHSINFSDQLDSVTYLYQTICKSYSSESLNQSINQLMLAGIERYSADVGLLLRPVSQQVYEVHACVDANNEFFVGQHISPEDVLCGRVLNRNETCAVANVSQVPSQSGTLAYNGISIGAYIGTAVNSHYQDTSVLCFISGETRNLGYSHNDIALIELMAEGIAYMTDQQKAQAQRKNPDLAMFANGSVKTLDEYLDQARLPELLGVPSRVLEVLQNRIGSAPLSISHVAEELNLSKRTLQRRLQQQGVNFADLRDKVRFHYSIDYLIKQHMSIDSISSALDFSDRTSFTNAFKRWTGLSPSTFRKLFRDYV